MLHSCWMKIGWRLTSHFFTRYLKRSVRHALCRSCVVYGVNSSQPRLLHNTVWWTSAYEWMNKTKEQTHQTLESYVVWVHTPRYCIASIESNNNHFWTRSISLLNRCLFFFFCYCFISLIFQKQTNSDSVNTLKLSPLDVACSQFTIILWTATFGVSLFLSFLNLMSLCSVDATHNFVQIMWCI